MKWEKKIPIFVHHRLLKGLPEKSIASGPFLKIMNVHECAYSCLKCIYPIRFHQFNNGSIHEEGDQRTQSSICFVFALKALAVLLAECCTLRCCSSTCDLIRKAFLQLHPFQRMEKSKMWLKNLRCGKEYHNPLPTEMTWAPSPPKCISIHKCLFKYHK